MKVGALILGMLGGLAALAYGLVGYGLGSLADAGEPGAGTWMKAISLGLPVAALLGAGLVMAQPLIGATLMALAAGGITLLLGFNVFSLVPIVLLGLGALLGFLAPSERARGVAREGS